MAQQAFYTKINASAGVQFSGGTIAQATGVLHTNNVLYLRGGSGGLYLQNADGSDGIFAANDHVQITTASAERLRVTSAGKVGIGTSSPSMALHVKAGDEATMLLESTSGEPAIFWAPGGTSLKWENRASASRWQLYQYDQSEWVFNIYDAKVGIGTVSPSYKLDVVGDVRIGSSFSSQKSLYFGDTNWSIRTENDYGSSTLDNLRYAVTDSSSSGHRFTNVNNDELLYIKGDGSGVGIGTSTPAALLDLTASTAPVFRMYRSGTGQVWTQEIDSSGRWQLREAASTGGTKYTRLQVDDPGNVTFSAYGSGSFTGTAAYNLQVDSSGNIIEGSLTSGTVTGSGTATYLPIWTGSSALGNSIISSSGGDVTINGSDDNPYIYINPSGGNIGDTARVQFNSRGWVGYIGGFVELGDAGQSKDIRLRVNTAQIFFQTSNTTRMTISTAGLVGIGKTPSQWILDVDSSDAYISSFDGSNNTGVVINSNTATAAQIIGYSNSVSAYNDLDIRSNSTSGSGIYIDGSANRVGIGTTSPSTKLHVYNGEATIASGTDGVKLSYSNGNSSGVIDTAFSDNALEFRTNGSSKMFITNAGNVGIGTVTPTEQLEVIGNIIAKDSGVLAGINGDKDGFIFHDLYTGGGNYYGYKAFTGGNTRLSIVTDGSERITALAGGNVGIGIASPLYELDVNGDIGTTRYIRHGGDSDTYFGFSGDNVIQFNVGGDEELYIKSAGDSANYPANIVYTDHNFQVGLDGGKHIGNRINYATSQGWVEDAAPTANQAGYYGGNFNLNGASTENQLGWGKNPWDARALIWTSINDSSSNSDGGWVKNISGLPGDNYAYMSIVYVKKNGTETSNTGSFYHGCSGSHTLNLDGNANTNPYFQSTSVNNLPDDVWCVSIGIIQANGDANTTTGGLIGGIYRLDTGQKVQNATTFKMKSGSTAQTHRTFLYYSTNTNNNLSWYAPGFYVVDGTEPTLAELVYAASATNGSGTTGYIPKWQDANTLTDSKLSEQATSITSEVPVKILDSVAANNPMLTLYNDTNGGGASIWFSDQATSAAQKGYLTFYHSDGSSQGGGSTFQFLSTEADMTLQVGGAGKASRVVVWSANSQAEVDYGFADDVNTGMTRIGADQVALIAGGVQGVYATATSVSIKNAGNTKLLTTGGGVDITGALAVGNINMTGTLDIQATYPRINLTDTNHDDDWSIINDDGSFLIYNVTDGGQPIKVDSSNNTTLGAALNIPSYIYHVNDGNTYFGFNTADSIQLVTGGGQRLLANNNGIKIGGGATVTTILDEDNMASNSDTALATQQSIKAYVDNSISGGANYLGVWDPDDSLNNGYGNPSLQASTRTDDSGDYYICSANGSAHPNGGTTEPDSWHVGDWVIWNEDLGSSGLWQKIDNTTVLSGGGTTNKVAKFTDDETIGDGPITFSSNNSTFAGQITVSGGSKLGGGTLQVTTDSTYMSNYTYTFRDAVGINNPNDTSAATSSTTVMAIGAKSGGTVNTSLITTGAVGIGTAAPAYTLHVNGTSNITNNAIFGGNVTVSGTGTSTFAGPVSITPPSATGWQGLTITGSGSSHTQGAIVLKSGTSDTPEARGQGIFMFNEGDDSTWYTGTQYQDADTWMLGRVAGTSLDTSAATSAQAFLEMSNAGNATFAGQLTVGSSGTGKDVMFYGDLAGEYFHWDENVSTVNIYHRDEYPGLEVYVNAGAQTTQPQLKVGRSSVQYWGAYVDDRNAHLVHRQDETSGIMTTRFDQWDSNTTDTSGNWLWRHGNGSGGSMTNAAILYQSGDMLLYGDLLTDSDSTADIGKTGERWANIWVDNINGAAPVVGSNYLPLAGGTMSGAIAMGNQNITGVNNIQANGNISLQTSTGEYSLYGEANGQTALYHNGIKKFETTSLGISVTGNMVASGDVYAEDNIYLTDTGTARAAISLDSSDRDNLNIKAISLGSIMRFYTVDTLALTLDASQNATFAGEISQIYNPGNTGAFQYLKNPNSGNSAYVSKKWQNDDAGFGEIWRNSSTRNAGAGNTVSSFNMYNSAAINFWPGGNLGLTLDASQNATFAGTVTADNIVKATNAGTENAMLQASATGTGYAGMYLDASNGDFSGNDYFSIVQKNDLSVEFDVRTNAGNTIFKSKGVTNLTMDGANSTFAGDVTVGDELTITTISNATADPDKFLCASGANKVGYRTGAQVLSDIGAASSGSLSNYLPLAGGTMTGDIVFNDNVNAKFGNSADLTLTHNSSNTLITNNTGNILFTQNADDKDITFYNDNGSGGTTEYFRLDGSGQYLLVSAALGMYFNDGIAARFGNSGDLYLYHNGTESVIANEVGNFYISQRANNSNIIFESDDGSGGVATYFQVDGQYEVNRFLKNARFNDSVKANFGTVDDLQIYHDGSNSYIDDTGTGDLKIRGETNIYIGATTGGANMAQFIKGGAVKLRFNDSNKFETTAAGVAVTGNVRFVGAGVGNCGTRYITYDCPDDSEYNVIGLTTGGVDIPGTLDVTGIVTLNNNLRLQDSDSLQLGNSQDLEIYHASGNSNIDNKVGHLYIRANVGSDTGSNIYIQAKSGENSIICNDDGSVNLYYNNSTKFYTHGSGVGAAGYYGFGSAGTSTGSSYYFRYGSNSAGATQGMIISTSDTGGSYFDGVAQFRNTNTGQGANMFQMINYGALYGRYMNFYRGSTSNIIGYIGYNSSNTAVTYSTSSSDIRLKKNIVDWSEDVLPKFLALTPKKFDFKAAIGDKGADKVKGFIAQYETENFPEVYQLNGEGKDARYGFHPMEMVPYLMKAVKELAQKNEDLERRLAALEK